MIKHSMKVKSMIKAAVVLTILSTVCLDVITAAGRKDPSALPAGSQDIRAAQSGPVDIRGTYVIVLDYVFSSTDGLNAQAALKLPGVDGMTLVCLWSSLEPNRGQYDWRTFDKWIGFADSLGKKITLVIKAGSGTPPWIFQPSPAGGGATPLNFRISPHEGKTGVCDTETIAAPWDTAYLAQWDTLLQSVSSHLQSTGTYTAITALRLTGINRTSDELRLPAETAESTGLPCVSDAISTWQSVGYLPSRVLQAWDAITNSFLKNFPDKVFSVAIIPNPPQLAFPPIADDGSAITGTVPDQNKNLLALAAQKFPGHLVVQFNFLLNNTPANIAVIEAAQTLGTLIAFQTNNYLSLSDSGAACGGTPANPVPCSAMTYLPQLETGIYPLGTNYSLRAHYIELWPIDANAFPADILQAHDELFASPPPQDVSISLGTPQQLFQYGKANAMGMSGVPDMHTTFVQQPDSSYRVWIAGRFYSDSIEGATGLVSTKDFLTYTPVGNATTAQVVLGPSCRPGSAACWNNVDADYAGADLVYPARNGSDLLMLYHAQTKYYGLRPPLQSDPSWCVLGLARSTDNGVTWFPEGGVVSGADPKPDTIPPNGIYGTVEPGAIVANGFVYAFYSYFPLPSDSDAGPPTIQVARSPLDSDAVAGSWTKFYAGSFGSQSGLGGLGSQVVPTVFADTRPAQPWPVYSSYLNAYVLIFIEEKGWYFTTSTDLVTWAPPKQFFAAPVNEFTSGQETDENVVLVTPGNPSQVIGQSGYVLYAHTPSWGSSPHELWMCPFTFNAATTGVVAPLQTPPQTFELRQNYPNPFNPSTTITYSISSRSHVRLTVYDELGRVVSSLVDEEENPGIRRIIWNGEDAGGQKVASGVYFFRLQAGPNAEVKKMLLVK